MDVRHSRDNPRDRQHHKDVGIVVPPKRYRAMGINLSSLRSTPSSAPRGRVSGSASESAPSSSTRVGEIGGANAAEVARRAELEKLTKERNELLDRWADPKILSLTVDEVELNKLLKKSLRYLFGQTGFDPPVPARNPVSVSMHNPRFAAALWAVNTEAYRRRNSVSRSYTLHLSRSRSSLRLAVMMLFSVLPLIAVHFVEYYRLCRWHGR